ncbi:cysteine dioxygenase family protein [Actinopolymorpha rutila]
MMITKTSTGMISGTAQQDLSMLAKLVQEVADDTARWRPLVRFRPGKRWWARLFANDHVDVWLLTWLSTQATELHDHGDSAGAFTVVAGALDEIRPDERGALTSQVLTVGKTGRVAVGNVHDVRNNHAAPAISIHAYSPRITRMTYYRHGPNGLSVARTDVTDEPEQDPLPERP